MKEKQQCFVCEYVGVYSNVIIQSDWFDGLRIDPSMPISTQNNEDTIDIDTDPTVFTKTLIIIIFTMR